MKLYIAFLPATLLACGGAPFTQAAEGDAGDPSDVRLAEMGDSGALDAASPVDSQADVVTLRDVGVVEAARGGSDGDVDAGADAGEDAGSEDAGGDVGVHDSGHDAAVCTPVSAMGSCSVLGGSSTESVTAPMQYCVWHDAVETTPEVCRCAETYTCACLAANGGLCAIGQTPSCDDSTGVLVVTCN